MAGLLAAAIGGAVAGAGQGMADVGKEMYLDQNLKLKDSLDTAREGYLQDLRNKGSLEVAQTGAAATTGAAQIAAGAHVTGAQIGAGATTQAAETAAAAHIEGSKIGAGATVQSARIHADMYRDIARNVNLDSSGNMFVLQNGKPQYLKDEDGDPIKSTKDVTPGTKLLVDGWQKRLTELNQDLNDPKKAMLLQSDPAATKHYKAEMDQLQRNIFTALGVDSAKFDLGAPAASGNRPPLGSFQR